MISVSFFSLKKHNWSLVFKLQRDVAILKTKTERHSAAPLVAVHQASYFHRLRLGQAKDMWLTPNNIHIHTERNRRGHRITKITNTYKKNKISQAMRPRRIFGNSFCSEHVKILLAKLVSSRKTRSTTRPKP